MLEAANRLNDGFIDFACVVPLLFPVSFCRATPYETDTNYRRMFNARKLFGTGAEADGTYDGVCRAYACGRHCDARLRYNSSQGFGDRTWKTLSR